MRTCSVRRPLGFTPAGSPQPAWARSREDQNLEGLGGHWSLNRTSVPLRPGSGPTRVHTELLDERGSLEASVFSPERFKWRGDGGTGLALLLDWNNLVMLEEGDTFLMCELTCCQVDLGAEV